MAQVVVFGTGAFAEVVLFYLTHDSPHEVVAFTVHAAHVDRDTWHDRPVVAFEDLPGRFPPGEHEMFVAIGYTKVNRVRAKVYAEAKAAGYALLTYVSSRCTHWGDTKIGDNCFIFEDNTIQPYVTIGDDTILWSGNHIGHHATIGEHCFISSHVVISGNVRVGAYTFIGVNATVRDNIEIGSACFIGPGAIIMKPTPERQVIIPKGSEPRAFPSDELRI
jgi:sugar O-acyltransferase (sialic acid O-acetyltransferase NeuD family)